MEQLGTAPLDHASRFTFDNLVEGVKDRTILIWYALDTRTGKTRWIVGRKINQTQVLPLAILEPDSKELVTRYAPALPNGDWDFSQTSGQGAVIIPQ